MNEKKRKANRPAKLISPSLVTQNQNLKPVISEKENNKNKEKLDEKSIQKKLSLCTQELEKTRQTLKRTIIELDNCREIKEQKQRTLEEVIECAGGPVFSIDKSYCFTSFNKHYAESMKELYGVEINFRKNLLECLPNPKDRTLAKKYMNQALKGETVKTGIFTGDGGPSRRYFEVAHYPVRGPDNKVKGVTVYARDVTDLKTREEEIQRIARTLKTLSNSNQAMMRAMNETEYMEEVCRNIEKDCGYAMVWIGLAENDINKSVRTVISAGFENGYLENAKISWGDNERGRGPTGTAIRTGKVSLCRNMLTDPQFLPWRNEAIKHGYASSIALPLIAVARPFGALTIYAKLPDAFTNDEVKILAELASDLAYGITAFKLRAEQERVEEELRKSGEQLRQANELLETVTEGTRVIISTIDTNYQYTYFNQAYKEEIARLTGKEIQIGTSLIEIFAELPEQQEVAVREWSRVLQGNIFSKNLEFGDPGRYRRIYNIRHTPLRDDLGNIIGAGEVAYDITEQEQAKLALVESEIRYQSLFNRMTEGFAIHEIICDENNIPCDYRFLDINPAFEQLTGLKREEIIGRCKSEISQLHGDDPKWVEIYGKVALTGEPVTFENYSPALERHYAVQSFQPEPGKFAVIFRDISERKKMEEVRNWLASFPELNPNPIVEIDYSGGIHYLNSAAKLAFPDLAAKGGEHPYFDGLRKVIDDCQKGETRSIIRDVSICEKYYRQTISCNSDSERVRIYCIDITALINAEQALRQGRDELELRIRERTLELESYRQHLEDVVRERTSQLENVNVLLQEEISERLHAERDLNIERGNLQMIFDVVNVGMFLLDKEGCISRANRVISQWTGKKFEEIQGSQPGDALGCIHAVTDPAGCGKTQFCSSCLIRKAFESALSTGQPVHDIEVESILVKDSAQVHLWFDLNADPFDIVGKKHVVLSMNDITLRKQAEESLREARDGLEERVQERTKELIAANEQLQSEIKERKHAEAARQESEGRYGTLFETSPDAIIVSDMDNKIVSANQQAAALHGFKDTLKLKGMKIVELIVPEDRRRVVRNIRNTREMGYVRDIEYQILTKNGSRIPAELNVSIVRNETGHAIGILMDIRDITERKRTADSIRLMYAYNRSLFEVSLDPLVTITPEGKIGDVNKATELVTGCTRAELIGTDFHNYFVDGEKARAGYQKVFEAGTVRDYNLEIRNKNGSLTPVLFNAAVYKDEAGEVRGVFAAARDITERKQFETQLVQAEKHAIIGRMVGSITHEINNPLQTIKNCLYLIQQDVTPESPIQEPLEMAASETLRLTNLVGHLRELYRPKAGINKQSNEILDIIEEVHSLLVPHLNSAKVQWQPLKGLQRCYIECVRDQILEVFLNISMNAIEAMQKNGGTLYVDMLKMEDRTAVVFKDTGPGIPEEIAQHMFEPFMTTKASGLGLGLSISYGIVQRHGGQILLENHPGQGATFTIWLPQASPLTKEEVIKRDNG